MQLSYSADDTGDDFYSDDVIKLPLQLPVILRCHVTVLSANHIEPNVTVSFDDVDMTSQFVRTTTMTSRSQDGDGPLATTDYVSQLEWNVTLRQLLDLHTRNWTCAALMTHHYPLLVTSSLLYVTCKRFTTPSSNNNNCDVCSAATTMSRPHPRQVVTCRPYRSEDMTDFRSRR